MLGGRSSIQLVRLFGIRIGASPSWFVVLFVFIYFLSDRFEAVLGRQTLAYALAVAAALLFFGSLILHELGHALAARREGIETSGIDLWFFGGVARLSRDTTSPGQEFRVAAAGPAVTLLVIVACCAVGLALDGDFVRGAVLETDVEATPATVLLRFLASINVLLFAFNLIPAFPLDGGRIARAGVWKLTGDRNKATRAAGRVGQGFSYLLIGGGLYLAVFGDDPLNGIYFVVLGWFLGSAARSAVVSTAFTERIDGITVADVMDHEPVTMPAGTPLEQAEDEFFLRYRWSWFPVVDTHGRFLGPIHHERVTGALGTAQPGLTVGELIDDEEGSDWRVRDDQPLEMLLGSERLRRLGALMAVDAEGVLRGVVTAEQVRRAVAATLP